MTCKQLVAELHEYIWLIFWLGIAVHIFLGVAIPLIRQACVAVYFHMRQSVEFHRQHSRDHEDLGTMINRDKPE